MFRQRQSKGGKRGKDGFTLIELLVVISIISLLMSILMPALGRAREMARQVHCCANMKGLTMSWIMYAFEHKDKLCSAATMWDELEEEHPWVDEGPPIPGNDVGGTEAALEAGSLWYYTQMPDLYKCVSDTSSLVRSYSISRAMNGKTCDCEHDNINPFKMYAEIFEPGERMVFIDASSREKWIDNSFSAIVNIEAETPEWLVNNYQNITARHLGGCNLSFADGHAKYWRYVDERTVKLANWEMDADEASDDNEDLEEMFILLRGPGNY